MSENEAPKPMHSKDSEKPHTTHTYSDFINSLSEGERESFLEFGQKNAAELKNPPVQLPQKWIQRNWEELANQWYKSAGKVSPAQTEKWENHPQRLEWIDKIRSLGFAAFIYESGSLDEQRKEFYEWANAKNLIWEAQS
jgi:hypothetical protein